MELLDIIPIGTHSDPLDYLCIWDFILLFAGVLLRLLKSISGHLDTKKLDFELSLYFDLKHVLRWLIHITVAVISLLVLPEIFVNYIQPEYLSFVTGWTIAGSAVIGWLGYDIVKFIELIYKKFAKKKGFE